MVKRGGAEAAHGIHAQEAALPFGKICAIPKLGVVRKPVRRQHGLKDRKACQRIVLALLCERLRDFSPRRAIRAGSFALNRTFCRGSPSPGCHQQRGPPDSGSLG